MSFALRQVAEACSAAEIYYVDCQKSSELPKDYKPGTLAPHATGLEDARRLLKLTEELTGVTFPNA